MADFSPPKRFGQVKHLIARSILSEPKLSTLADYILQRFDSGGLAGDIQLPNTLSASADPMTETLLEELRPTVERYTGLDLLPTYSYFRVYQRGEALARHRDRPACEISITLNAGYSAPAPWPIYIETPQGVVAAELNAGDSMIYRGCECAHWRDALDGEFSAQILLHYVNAKGPHAEWKFDKRERLNC